ncbi:hypothetical protein Tco_1301058 [Tanacetum coccineum]
MTRRNYQDKVTVTGSRLLPAVVGVDVTVVVVVVQTFVCDHLILAPGQSLDEELSILLLRNRAHRCNKVWEKEIYRIEPSSVKVSVATLPLQSPVGAAQNSLVSYTFPTTGASLGPVVLSVFAQLATFASRKLLHRQQLVPDGSLILGWASDVMSFWEASINIRNT